MIEGDGGIINSLTTVVYVTVVSAVFYIGYDRLESVLRPTVFELLKRI